MPMVAVMASARSSSPSAAARRLLATCGALLALGLVAASPAGALVTPIGAPQFGVEPHSETPFTTEPSLPLEYHGGPVMHSNSTYAIYWDPTQNPSAQYDGDWKSLINHFLQDVGNASGRLDNVYALTPLYTDTTGRAAYSSSFGGAYTDTTAYPSSDCTDPDPGAGGFACLTDAQLRMELGAFIAAHHLQTGLGTIFFLFTPPGVTVCTDAGGGSTGHCSDSEPSSTESYERSFCSYHSYIAGESPTLYAVQPWTAGTLGTYGVEHNGGVDCQGGTGVQQEPNQTPGRDTDGDFDLGLADVIINEVSVEQIATETDPLLNGWYAPKEQANKGNEVTDQCRNWFQPVLGGSEAANASEANDSEAGTLFNQHIGERSYYLNTEYDQAALTQDYPGVACIPGVRLAPSFTSPDPVNAGDIVGFDGTESDVALGVVNYKWNFGDGTAPESGANAGSVFHSFTYGGTYEVTLTVTDGGGNIASVANRVTVDGPPPPTPEGGGGSGSGEGPGGGSASSSGSGSGTQAGASGSSGSGGSSGGGTPKVVPNPLVTASVLSHSLRQAVRHGLAVRYSVNEQVTGRFEVLLSRTVARRLRIGGPLATGMPAGSSPEVVIGRAILVTTAGGRSSVRIRFAKGAASRLRRLGRVSLTLRLFVRNASSQPASTTLLSAVTLRH
jgi:uncharacterized membrane protein YgcG